MRGFPLQEREAAEAARDDLDAERYRNALKRMQAASLRLSYANANLIEAEREFNLAIQEVEAMEDRADR